MITFKIDVYDELLKKGWTPKKIRDTGMIGQKTLQEIRSGEKTIKGIKTLESVCFMLKKQPGAVAVFSPDSDTVARVEEYEKKEHGTKKGVRGRTKNSVNDDTLKSAEKIPEKEDPAAKLEEIRKNHIYGPDPVLFDDKIDNFDML